MAAPKRRLPQTFPHRIILVTSLVLCLCAGASIVFGVVAWSNALWGYYMATGFWSGGVILLAGIFGIVCSFVRNTCSVKAFMIISILGCLVSLGMIALAAGGLDSNSGFYKGGNKTASLTHVCYLVYLGVGVLQLTLCVLDDGICIYYLFVEKSAELYSVKRNGQKKKKNKPIVRRNGHGRASTESETPLMKSSSKSDKHKQKHRKSKKQPVSQTEDGDLQLEDALDHTVTPAPTIRPLSAKLLRRQDELNLTSESPSRRHCARSASFSTFGHHDGPDRISLIVHSPDDNASVSGTTRTHTPDPHGQKDTECHYAQTLLFEPPLPIEEDDDELPPYEAVDTRPYSNITTKRVRRPKSADASNGAVTNSRQVHRSKSLPSRSKKHDISKRHKLHTTNTPGAVAMPGRQEIICCESDTERKYVIGSRGDPVVLRHSRSVDLLSLDNESHYSDPAELGHSVRQGVVHRDFAHSSELLIDMGVQMRNKHSHSVKVVREKRLDRRRRALSAEVKWNKDQFMVHEHFHHNQSGLANRTNSLDGSNSSLFASNRIMPTKFSLRTPIRKVGMPHVCSPVPVKPIPSLSLFSPPPKPPRTHSVTLDDLGGDTIDYADAEDVFANIEKLTSNRDLAMEGEATEQPPSKATKSVSANKQTNRDSKANVEVHLNHENDQNKVSVSSDKSKKKDIKLESINVNTSTNLQASSNSNQQSARSDEPTSPVSPSSASITLSSGPVLKCVPPKAANKTAIVKPSERTERNSMILPVSPILKQPPVSPILNFSPTLKQSPQLMPDAIDKHKGTETPGTPNKPVVAVKTDAVIQHVKGHTKDSAEQSVINAGMKLEKKDVVYSKIDKKSNEKVNPEVGPTKPVQKPRKLLFSFSDKDKVSVFDPSPVAECATEMSGSMTKNGDTPKQEEVKHEKEINVDELKDLHVRLPPVSPSERILHRKNLTSSIQFGNDNPNMTTSSDPKQQKPVIINSVAHNGARPKTTFKGEPIPTPRIVSPTKQGQPNSVPSADSRMPSSTTAPKSCPAATVKPNVFSTKSAKPVPPVRRSGSDPSRNEVAQAPRVHSLKSKPGASSEQYQGKSGPTVVNRQWEAPRGVVNGFNRRRSNSPHSKTPRDTRDSRVASTPAGRSTNSQGVLHLPQSQHSRQVTGNAHNQAPPVNQDAAANIQPVQAVNNNTSSNRPLFSVVL